MRMTNEEMYRQLGLNIAYYRKLRHLTQEQLALKTGITRAFLGHIEAPNMTVSFSMRLCLTFRARWKLSRRFCLSSMKMGVRQRSSDTARVPRPPSSRRTGRLRGHGEHPRRPEKSGAREKAPLLFYGLNSKKAAQRPHRTLYHHGKTVISCGFAHITPVLC